jgi:hypothetical protein
MEYGKGRNVCYAGEWEGDRKQGKGQFLFPSRNTYEGMWSEGKPHGLGTQVQCLFWEPGIPLNNLGITNKDHPNTILANIYEGDWKEGFPEGRFIFQIPYDICSCLGLFVFSSRIHTKW